MRTFASCTSRARSRKPLALCLGESNRVFERFDAALEKTIDINDKAFKEAVKRSLAELGPFDVGAPLVALAVAALALAGIWPRLREYAVG